MRAAAIWLLGMATLAAAQLSTQSASITEDAAPASATYASLSTTITIASDETNATASASGAANSTSGGGGTLLVGTAVATTANGTASGSQRPMATNTVPCNGYVEFCQRNYSNITWVGAHNSPFHIPNNAASNQKYGVVAQLNDGIRLLQGQTHSLNGVMHYCHTTCDLLDAGSAEDYFSLIAAWLDSPRNRFEVITMIIGNGDFVDVESFEEPMENSGLKSFAYVPYKIPMGINDWPTMGELIALNKRAIIFMDYHANQTAVPYIMDEFTQVWETPFSPQNSSFPCTVQRPPKLGNGSADNRMFMLNNNLNVPVDLFGAQILIPNIAALNTTNAASGEGSLGLSTNGCVADWDRSPNFLLVDYYEAGNFPGSVFQVSARANGVQYKPGDCCGNSQTINRASRQAGLSLHMLSLAVFTAAVVVLL